MPSPRDAARRLPEPIDSDRQCFERLRAGDPAAFESLFRRYADSLRRFAISYVQADAIAEELVQDLFCWVWDHRFVTDVPNSVRAYLFASLRNRAVNHVRRERMSLDFHLGTPRTAMAAVPRDADADLMAEDLSSAVRDCVRTMPTRCREVFGLLRDDHLTYAEVAEVLGISVKTVEIHMSRALASLRTRLAPWLSA